MRNNAVWWLVVAVLVAAVALGVAHLVYEPKPGVSPEQYARWRDYCEADADSTYVHGTSAWSREVNDCLVDVATADAKLDR